MAHLFLQRYVFLGCDLWRTYVIVSEDDSGDTLNTSLSKAVKHGQST